MKKLIRTAISVILLLLLCPILLPGQENSLTTDEVAAIFEKGLEYYEQNDYVKAVLEWDEIIRYTGVVDRRLKTYYRHAYENVYEKSKLLIRGIDLYNEEEYREAREVFQNVLTRAPYDKTAENYLEKSGLAIAKQRLLAEIDLKLKLAEQHSEQGEYRKAKAEVEAVILLDPDHKKARRLLRQIEQDIQAQDFQEQIDLLMEQGRQKYLAEQYGTAADIYNQVLALEPDHAEAGKMFRNAMFQLEKSKILLQVQSLNSNGIRSFDRKSFEESQLFFDRVLALDPQNSTALDYKAKLRMVYENLRQQQILTRQIEGYYLNGVNYFNAGDYTRSRSEFENVVSLQNDYRDAREYLKKITELLEQRKISELREKQDQILELLNQGISYYQIGEYKSAVYSLNRCLELDPENVYARDYLSKAKESLYARSQEEIDEDSPYYEIILKFFEDSRDYFEKGDMKRSLSYLEKIILLFPGNKQARDLMTKITLKLDPDAAEIFLSRHYDAAMSFYKNKDFGKALKEFEMIRGIRKNYRDTDQYIQKIEDRLSPDPVVRINPEKLKEYYQSGLSCYSRGEYATARKEWEKVLQDTSPENPYRVRAIVNINKINLREKYSAESSRQEDSAPQKARENLSEGDAQKVKNYYLRGVAFYINGDYISAMKEWEEALKIDPNNTKVQSSVAKCRMKLAGGS